MNAAPRRCLEDRHTLKRYESGTFGRFSKVVENPL